MGELLVSKPISGSGDDTAVGGSHGGLEQPLPRESWKLILLEQK